MEKILIIDDDTALCELVVEYLAAPRIPVEAVHRGDTGVATGFTLRTRSDSARRNVTRAEWLRGSAANSRIVEDAGSDADRARR